MRCVFDGQARDSGAMKGHHMSVQKSDCEFL